MKYRGKKLDLTEENKIFEATVFKGTESKKLGLVDELMTEDEFLAENFKDHKVVNYSVIRPLEKLK